MHNQLLQEIKENRFKDTALQIELCDQLYSIGKCQNDNLLIGAAYMYKSEAYIHSSINDSESNAILCLQYLSENEGVDLYAHAHNILGVINTNKNDAASALDYFLKCKSLCEEHNLTYELGLCLTNLGMCLQILEAYDKAIPYYEEAIDSIMSSADGQINYSLLIKVHCNLFSCLYKINDCDGAKTSLDLLQANPDLIEAPIILPLYEAQYYYLIGQYDMMEKKIDETLTNCYSIDNLLPFIDEFLIFCGFLYDLEKYSYLIKVLDWIDSKIDSNEIPRTKIKLLKYRLKCIVEQHDFSEYEKWSDEFIRTFDLLSENFYQSIIDSAELRLYIANVKKQEEEERRKEITDPLTQFYNRIGFRYYAERLLKKATREKKPIAFFFIEVDFYKEIEDFYGKEYAEQCLLCISDALIGLQDSDTIIGKYNKSIFMLFTYDKSYDEIEQMAKSFHDYVDSLQLQVEPSTTSDYLTISQGIFYGILTEFESISDCIRQADIEMRSVIHDGRNGYKIATEDSL